MAEKIGPPTQTKLFKVPGNKLIYHACFITPLLVLITITVPHRTWLPNSLSCYGTPAYAKEFLWNEPFGDGKLVGNYDTPGYAKSVHVSGDTAYVADGGSGLLIIDISNPSSPTLLGSYDTPDGASGVYVSGTTAYVANGGSELLIIDVSDFEGGGTQKQTVNSR